MAGGIDEIADTEQIFVFRNPYGGNRSVLEYNLDDIEDGKVPDPLLKGTDIIVVDSSSGRKLLRDITGTMRGFVSLGALPVF
jgi:polysaccharide export outer membrane protein